jgi:IS605 OrfB family transposase
VKLTVQIKLLPTPDQAMALKETLETANLAANRLSQLAWEKKEFRQFPMHRLFYKQIRNEFPLSAQIVIRLNAKVADAYKLDKKVQRTFRKHGSISYDLRILSFQLLQSTVDIWTTKGRLKHLPFVCGERQRKLLELPKGESDLILRHEKWFLNVTVDVPEEQEQEAIGWLGIDLGLVNLAQSSDGQTFGEARFVANIRARRWRQRKRLQSRCTRSAKRVLRKLSGKESRFVTQHNHLISKQICAEAKRTKRGIALENLKGIRSRTRASKKQRRILHSWAFADLQSKIVYKSRLLGVPVRFVNARNTSRTCSACGSVSKKNRPTRDQFVCQSCGFTADADTNAACEIARRAAIVLPDERDGVRVHVQNQVPAPD